MHIDMRPNKQKKNKQTSIYFDKMCMDDFFLINFVGYATVDTITLSEL